MAHQTQRLVALQSLPREGTCNVGFVLMTSTAGCSQGTPQPVQAPRAEARTAWFACSRWSRPSAAALGPLQCARACVRVCVCICARACVREQCMCPALARAHIPMLLLSCYLTPAPTDAEMSLNLPHRQHAVPQACLAEPIQVHTCTRSQQFRTQKRNRAKLWRCLYCTQSYTACALPAGGHGARFACSSRMCFHLGGTRTLPSSSR